MFHTINLTVLLAVLACAVLSREVSDGPQNVLINEAANSLLGFKDEHPRGKISPYGAGQEAPKYMLDLYDRFRNSQISKGHLSGNTVRSIHAEIAEVNGEEMFVFNLTSIIPSERLLSAEIHLYKRKMKKARRRRRDLELLMYEIAPHYMTENGKITMRAESFGWQWYDVTDAALSCLAARRDTPHLFALKFQVEWQNGKVKDVALKKFIRHHSMPFLIIYSNDTQNNELDSLENLAGKMQKEKKEDRDFVDSNTDTLVDFSRRFTDDKLNSEVDSNEHSPQDKTSKSVQRRQKRSIFNNKIPEDPADYDNFHRKFNIPQTHPDILQSRRENRHKISDSRLIPYPDEERRKNRRNNRKNRKNRRKNRRRKNKNSNLLFPKEWDRFRGTGTEENQHGDICSKRKLILDFADIGWEDKIIAPKSFEAHYCAGSCPFPLTKKLRPSNHATIQSMVHAIGIHTDVPAPCCVPESLSSITLLFFDSNRNVVLKNYPSMSVKACGCR